MCACIVRRGGPVRGALSHFGGALEGIEHGLGGECGSHGQHPRSHQLGVAGNVWLHPQQLCCAQGPRAEEAREHLVQDDRDAARLALLTGRQAGRGGGGTPDRQAGRGEGGRSR